MSQRIAKLLKMLTRMATRLLMVLRPKAAERWRCWTIAGMAEAPWQRSVVLHLIAAGVSVEGARAEMAAFAEEHARIHKEEKGRIMAILIKAQPGQGQLADRLIHDDVETDVALRVLWQDHRTSKAVDAIFAGAEGGEDSTHGTC